MVDIVVHLHDVLHGLVHDLLALVFANVVQQLLVFFGSWQASCDQGVQAAEALGVFVLRKPVGFIEDIFAFLGSVEIIQGARQDLLAELRGQGQIFLDESLRCKVVVAVNTRLNRLLHDGGAEAHGGRLDHPRALLGFLPAQETFAARVGTGEAKGTVRVSVDFDFLNFSAAVGGM